MGFLLDFQWGFNGILMDLMGSGYIYCIDSLNFLLFVQDLMASMEFHQQEWGCKANFMMI
jgi:hypothetical protein